MYNNPDPGLGGRAAQTFGPNGQAYRSYYESTNKLLEPFLPGIASSGIIPSRPYWLFLAGQCEQQTVFSQGPIISL